MKSEMTRSGKVRPVWSRRLAPLLLIVGLLPGRAFSQSEDERAFQFAERLYRDGLYELAHEQFDRFVDDYPRSDRVGQALLLAADSLIRLDRLDDALAVYDRTAERFRRSPLGCEASYKRAAILAERGRVQEALRGFDALQGGYPDCPRRYDAAVGAAEALIELGRPDEALARIGELPADPERPGMLARTAFTRARALEAAGETGNALAAYEAVLQLFPATVWEDRSRVARARLLAREGYHREAIAELTAVGEHGHEDATALRAEALALSGELLARLGRIEESAGAFAGAAELAGEDAALAPAWTVRAARAYQRADRVDRAYGLIKSLDPGSFADPALALEATQLRAELARATRAYDEAIAAIEELEASAHSDTLAADIAVLADSLAFDALLLAAEIELDRDQPERAAHLLRTWPQEGAPARRRARVARRLGTLELDELERPFEARAAFRTAVSAWEASGAQVPPDLYMELGAAEEALQNWPAARAAYHAAYAGRPQHGRSAEARAREAYVRDYLEVDAATASRKLATLAERSARGEIDDAEALSELAAIRFELLKDYEASLGLYRELLAGAEEGAARVDLPLALYRAGRAAILEAQRHGQAPDRKLIEEGHRYFSRLSTDFRDHPRADDAELALIEARFDDAEEVDFAAEAQAYQTMLERFPRSDRQDVVLLRLGEIYRDAAEAAGGDSTSTAVARDYFAAVVRDHAESARAPEAAYWRAVMAERLGEEKAAQAGYQDCLRLYPQGSRATESHFRLGELALEDRRLDDARGHYGWIRDNNPEHPLAVQALARLGDCDLMEGDFEAARSQYRAMLTADPSGELADQAAMRIAETYERQGNWGEAEASLTRFLADFPQSPHRGEVDRQLGRLRMRRGDAKGAAEAFARYLEGNPESLAARAARFELAEALRAAGDGKAALDIYETLAKSSAVDSLALRDRQRARAERVILLYELDREKDARRSAERFAEEFPESDAWILEIAIARGNYLLRTDPEAAAAHFEALLETHAGRSGIERVLYGRGLVALGARDFETAIGSFEHVLRESPAPSLAYDTHFKLGTCLYSVDRYAEAAQHYRRASELAPDPDQAGDALHNLGLSLERAQHYDEAIRVYREIERDYADTPPGLRAAFKVGFVYQEWGKLEQAISAYRRVLPRQSGEEAAETQFWIAECYESRGELETAAAEYLKVGYLYPDSGMWAGTARFRAGEVYEKLGRLDDAQAVYSALAREDSGEWGSRAAEKLRLLSQEGN